MAPTFYIRNTVLTGSSSHKNGWEKQSALLSLCHKSTDRGRIQRKNPSAQLAKTEHPLNPPARLPGLSTTRALSLTPHHRHPPISAKTHFPGSPHLQGPPASWQLLHQGAFSSPLQESPQRAAAVSASGQARAGRLCLPTQHCQCLRGAAAGTELAKSCLSDGIYQHPCSQQYHIRFFCQLMI